MYEFYLKESDLLKAFDARLKFKLFVERYFECFILNFVFKKCFLDAKRASLDERGITRKSGEGREEGAPREEVSLKNILNSQVDLWKKAS